MIAQALLSCALAPMSLLSLLSASAIFGFFYAWVCSTMWGLDSADPIVAIPAMQAMNASVRNAVFFPAFFLTPVFLAVTAGLAYGLNRRRAALILGMGAAVYICGPFLVTALINVPMNEALALIEQPPDPMVAAQIWAEYSEPWQFWNILRTILSAVVVLMTGTALFHQNQRT